MLGSGNAAPAPAAQTALALAGESESLNGRCQTFSESVKRYFSGFSSVCAYSTSEEVLIEDLGICQSCENATNWVRGHWPALDESTTF